MAEHLGWPGPFLSDPDRLLYRRLGLGRARRREVYTPETMRIYRDAARRGVPRHRPLEDVQQLGGDAVVRQGRAARVFRPASPVTVGWRRQADLQLQGLDLEELLDAEAAVLPADP